MKRILSNMSASLRMIVATIAAVVLGTVAFAGPSMAAPSDVTVPADPTGGAMASSQASIQTWVITYGVPVLFGLLLLGVLIKLGTKWFKKAAAKV